jgi:cation diffusion facilitator CzcD-associated flavoprotein CzcO
VTLPSHVAHLVVGAGFSGVGTAIKLDDAGETDFLVIDRGHDVGGTWRDNTYPGAACDVPSQLYSFSFAPNPDWSSSYSPQPEIHAYIRRIAQEAGVLDRFVFGTELTGADWDEAAKRWRVSTTAGEITAEHLILGVGGLSEPKLPDIEGIDSFAGQVFHSARWDHSVDLTGKRIAVIGTGASAIQIVPELQKVAGQLDVYQRTAPWVIPRNDRKYPRLEQTALRHLPGLQKAYREGIFWGKETLVPAFLGYDVVGKVPQALALHNLRKGIKDPALREKVTPSFQIGCKRILISNTYYPALASDNVELVTDRITKVTGNAVVTADGAERPIDVLVVATGFFTTDLPVAHIVRGRDGVSLADRWAGAGMSAY